MLRGWLREKKGELNASTHSLNASAEPENIEASMRAANHIMNDDLQAADDGLAHGPDPNSSFHKLGKGMVAFLRATLGFEPEIMREASDRLADAETTASADRRKAQLDSNVYRSAIYPLGSEFALCHAQSQLMSAVVAVLNESLTEGIRGFYKLRKAFVTLNTILDAENKYMRSISGESLQSNRSVDSLRSTRSAAQPVNGAPGGLGDQSAPPGKHEEPLLDTVRQNEAKAAAAANAKAEDRDSTRDEDDDADDDFYDADEFYDEKQKTEEYTGHIEIDGVVKDLAKSSMESNITTLPPNHQILDHDPDSDVFSNPIDVFIHSGANLCFGLLLVMISMIPPAFGKLLLIIGFHGDRDRGLRLLWQASKFHNINGAMAGLTLLGFYHAVVGFADILPDLSATDSSNVQGYPKQRCEALLQDMRTRHPKSQLWILEEARMQAMNRRLSTALSILESSSKNKSPLKQVEALNMFEKGLNAMYIHDYALCAESFIECVKLNNWSHALYYYIAGAAHVEAYRHCAPPDPDREMHAEKATEYLRLAPKYAGKKKFMARQLPFDVFVTRKVKKWEHRCDQWDLRFIDVVGVSPLEEMVLFWNGYRRMDDAQLRTSLDNLAWSDNPNPNSIWKREESDERAVLAVLRATTLRHLGRWDEAVEVLRKDVLAVDKAQLKGGLRDDWTAPVAHYEMGAVCWMRRRERGSGTKNEGVGNSTNGGGGGVGEGKTEEKWVKECEGWIEKAAKWESYELDARVGLKVATAQDTLKKWREGVS